jgi:aminomethyltransferase
MCNERGGAIDDLYACRLADDQFLLVINAARIEADTAWLVSRQRDFTASSPVEVQDVSGQTGAVAVQGPRVVEFINQTFPGPFTGGTEISQPIDLKKNRIARCEFEGTELWISRTGYTGEDGFEIVAPAEIIETVWNRLLEVGGPHGLKPAGLGARDTLRLEACYPLYGHELDEETTPIEAGLGFFVALDKGDFIGRSVLAAQKADGVRKKLVAFTMSGKSAPPRAHYGIWQSNGGPANLGEVTSGTQSPSLGQGIGLGYVPSEFAKSGTPLEIEIRGRRFPAVVVPKPFYRKLD